MAPRRDIFAAVLARLFARPAAPASAGADALRAQMGAIARESVAALAERVALDRAAALQIGRR